MRKIKIKTIGIIVLLTVAIAVILVSAVTWSPQGNVDLKNLWNMTNLNYFESFKMLGNIIMNDFNITGADLISANKVTAGNVVYRDDWTTHDDYPADCPSGYFVKGLGDTLTCEAAAGGGDITGVYGDNIYIYNGSASGEVYLAFNETKLNETIDDREVDTNANTICVGTTVYLDGEGNCDDISGVYVDVAGDTMTGNLAMSDNNITGLDYVKFTGGGYIYDNGTTLILGHT